MRGVTRPICKCISVVLSQGFVIIFLVSFIIWKVIINFRTIFLSEWPPRSSSLPMRPWEIVSLRDWPTSKLFTVKAKTHGSADKKKVKAKLLFTSSFLPLLIFIGLVGGEWVGYISTPHPEDFKVFFRIWRHTCECASITNHFRWISKVTWRESHRSNGETTNQYRSWDALFFFSRSTASRSCTNDNTPFKVECQPADRERAHLFIISSTKWCTVDSATYLIEVIFLDSRFARVKADWCNVTHD